MGIVPWTGGVRSGYLYPAVTDFLNNPGKQYMLFDVVFFGLPLILGSCLAVHAAREEDIQFWRPAFSFFAYCTFYLAGGREVLLYLCVGLMVGSGWCAIDGAGAI